MPKPSLAVILGLGRAAFGGAAYAVPQLLTERAGMPGAGATADARFMTRMFGARDLVVGVLTMLPATRSASLKLGISLDAFDTVSGILAEQDGVEQQRARMFTGVAAGFAAAGVLAAIASR